MLAVDIGHAKGAVEGWAVCSAADDAAGFFLSCDKDLVSLAGDASAVDKEAAEGFGGALFLNFFEFAVAHEGVFVELDGELQASFEGIGVFIEFVAVEGHSGFKAQGISSSEAACFESQIFPCFEEAFEHEFGAVGVEVEFKAIFAGVSGACDEAGNTEDGAASGFVSFDGFEIEICEGAGDFDCVRALKGDHGPIGGDIFDVDILIVFIVVEPLENFVCVGGVDDEQEEFGEDVVDHVVEDVSFLVGHEGVAGGAGFEPLDFVGDEFVEEGDSIFAGDEDASHVSKIEESGGLANGVMFIFDAAVSNGHLVSGEGDHGCAEGDVEIMEGGLFHSEVSFEVAGVPEIVG